MMFFSRIRLSLLAQPSLFIWVGAGVSFALIFLFHVARFFWPQAPTALPLEQLNYIEAESPMMLSGSVDVFDPKTKSRTSKDLKGYIGKPFLLHFWATWCGPCQKELPSFDLFAKKKLVPTLAVMSENSADPEKIVDFYKTSNIQNLEVVVESQGELAKTFQIEGLPTTIVFNAKGEEVGRFLGILEWEHPAVQATIRELIGA